MKTYQEFLEGGGEKKWQKYWEDKKLFKTPKDATPQNKFYILPQLPYPSGAGLHVGHAEVYSACDIYARYQRMKGKKVLQAIGWDSFGLPAENYAIKTNVHPKISTNEAIDNFREQIKSLGISVDWDREVGSHNSDYYKWTQWFFLLMYKRGLAYRKKQAVNWCESCKTVLANEQVTVDGKCERCDTVVVQRDMEQWYLKITDYAEKLLKGIDDLDWPEETKKRQKDWIGKSEGAEVNFSVISTGAEKSFKQIRRDLSTDARDDSGFSKVDTIIKVFTTRPDTLFGATFMVLAPEGQYVKDLKNKIENWDEVAKYIKETSKKTELDRQIQKEKTGVELKGIKAINPASGEETPIFIADYVLATYGTGAIMAVPAHDERDFEFATKFGVEVREVVDDTDYGVFVDKKNVDFLRLQEYEKIIFVNQIVYNRRFCLVVKNKNILNKIIKNCILKDCKKELWVSGESAENWYKEEKDKKLSVFTGEGTNVNSDFLNGLSTLEAKSKMIEWLEENNFGKRKIQYKLRDWSVSRQRFWGAPIPMLANEELRMKNEELSGLPNSVLNLHAWGSGSEDHYHPWVDKHLKSQEIKSVTPELPDTNYPVLEKWLETSYSNLLDNSENTVITSRSLSCWLGLKIAETRKVRKLILVAPTLPTKWWCKNIEQFCESKEQYKMMMDFVNSGLDFEKVKDNVGELVVFLSLDDPYINLEDAEKFFQEYFPQARIIRIREAGHFSADRGYEKFDKLFEEILSPVILNLKPVPESDLPVILPEDVDFKPTGESPLNYSKSFNEGIEKEYGEGWKREPDTLDTFMCSSWYYYRYLDSKNDKEFASKEALKKWMPIDFYLGGPEHVNGHLLYSRFFTKVLHDAGFIDFDEPFKKHRHQGLILGADNRKMSKRWGNAINPTDVVKEYGADTTRMYEMFMGPLEDDKPWNMNGVKGVKRFLDKVWNLFDNITQSKNNVILIRPVAEKDIDSSGKPQNDKKLGLMNKTIKKVSEDMEEMKYNTAIAQLMTWVNELLKHDNVSQEEMKNLVLLLSPFAPHLSEELWEKLGNKNSISGEDWPEYNPELIKDDVITLAVQINGKFRHTFEVSVDESEEKIKDMVLGFEQVKKWLEGKEPKKVIYVKGKLVSIVL